MIPSRRLLAASAAVAVMLLFSGVAFSAAFAASGEVRTQTDWDGQIDKKSDQAEAAKERQEELASELEHTDAAIIEANDKLQELNDQLPPLQAAYKAAQNEVDAAVIEQGLVADRLIAAQARDKAITEQINEDNARVERLQNTVAALARESYKGAGREDSLGVVFEAESSDEFVDQFAVQHSLSRVQSNALAEVEEIAAINRNRGTRQVAVRAYIDELKAQADALVVEANAARDVAKEKKAKVDAQVAKVQKQKDVLAAQRDTFIAQQEEQQRLVDELLDEVKDLVAKKLAAEQAAREKAHQDSLNPTPIGKGYMNFPTEVPYITSSYGMRYHPIFHYSRKHAGTDFRAYCGTPIYAAAAGKVEWARRQGGFGNQVMVDHGIVNGNSLMSSYNHLARFAVSAGQIVTQGQVLGYEGSTGTSTACHLHFEVYVNGDDVNPMSILGPIP